MKIHLLSIVSVLLTLLLLDALWLGTMMKRFYVPQLGSLVADAPKWGPALAFYTLYALGVVFFLVIPAVQQRNDLFSVFLWGAFFGLVAYGTYDLTNHATLKDWPWAVTLVDMVWGAVLTGLTSSISVSAIRLFM